MFFSPFGGVFVLFGGVFAFFGGVFVLLGIFLFFARQRGFFWVVNFLRGTTPKRGIPALSTLRYEEPWGCVNYRKNFRLLLPALVVSS